MMSENFDDKPRGFCRLCGNEEILVDGHIWPKFAYKRYISDLAKGGSFITLERNGGRTSNRQVTEYMFCAKCDNERIGDLDKSASLLCGRFDDNQTDPQPYDGKFMRFAVSLALRVAIMNLQSASTPADGLLRSASKVWREFLLQRRKTVGALSLHAFVVYEKQIGLHKAAGARVIEEEGVILMQLGPMFMFSILSRAGMSLTDLKMWEASRLSEDGGIIAPVDEWRVGRNITMPAARILVNHEFWVKKTILESVK